MAGWNTPPPKRIIAYNPWLTWISLAVTLVIALGLLSLLWSKMVAATPEQVQPTHSLEQAGAILSTLAPSPTATLTPTLAAATPVATPRNAADFGSLIRFCGRVPYPKWEYDADLLDLPADPGPSVQASFTGGRVTYRPTCTYDPGNRPQVVVLHFTGGNTLEGAVAALRKIGGPSIHYVIDRDGRVVQMLPESLAAYHITCQADACLSNRSIGIELVNLGRVDPQVFTGPVYEDPLRAFNYPYWEEYPPAQRQALEILVRDISARWGIPLDSRHVLGHYQVNAKSDPGPALNLFWERPGDGLLALFGEASP